MIQMQGIPLPGHLGTNDWLMIYLLGMFMWFWETDVLRSYQAENVLCSGQNYKLYYYIVIILNALHVARH